MLKRAGFLLVLAVLTFGMSGIATTMARQGQGAGGGQEGPRGPRAGGIMRALDQLDLTDEQRDQLRVTFHESMAGDLGRLRQEQRERQRELARLIADPTTEESAIVSAVRAAAEREEKLALAQHQLHVALFGILSEEQREEAQALIAELPRRARADGRGKRRNAPGSE